MLRENRLAKVLPAVQECLQHCLKSENPTREMGLFLDCLRRSPLWNDAEVEEIEKTARRAVDSCRFRTDSPR